MTYRNESGTIVNGVRKAYASKGDDATFSRFVKIKDKKQKRTPRYQWKLPGLSNPSIEKGRSLFHLRGVKPVSGNVLVSGHNNVKIGRDVRKGRRFRGYWIFTLTLEERATCPRSCEHWQTCYGNNMPFAKRIDHRDSVKLQAAIERNIQKELNKRGRKGILIRLHALGDFFSAEYVWFWANMLRKYNRLAVFGYTAYSNKTPIGKSIEEVRDIFGFRFSIRVSNDKASKLWSTRTVVHPFSSKEAIQCPEQVNLTDGCGKCGLCWNTNRNIAFVQH